MVPNAALVHEPSCTLLAAVYHPSIALFVLMPLILGTSIISPLNVLVALNIYSFSLMVRSGVDAFDSVPDSVHESARALGYTPRQALMELYLPLAVPVIMAGIRVATVANIAMVSVGALIGVPSLGTLFTDGLARNIPSEILAGGFLACCWRWSSTCSLSF